jgi:hypothetical protein
VQSATAPTEVFAPMAIERYHDPYYTPNPTCYLRQRHIVISGSRGTSVERVAAVAYISLPITHHDYIA